MSPKKWRSTVSSGFPSTISTIGSFATRTWKTLLRKRSASKEKIKQALAFWRTLPEQLCCRWDCTALFRYRRDTASWDVQCELSEIRGVEIKAIEKRIPDRAVRAFQVQLVSSGISWPALNQTVCALLFFYGVTLGHDEIPERPPTRDAADRT